MARLTRQELKKDQLAEQFAAAREFLVGNRKQIAIVSLIAVLALGIVIGGFLYVSSRGATAGSSFSLALTTFHAPVTDTPPPNFNGPSFKTANEKYQQALKQFNEVADRYSWFSQGKFARYYAALCQGELGNLQEAEKGLKTVAAGGNKELASLAKMALAGLYEQSGRNDEAEKLYREIADNPTDTVPKATAELALADFYQKTKPTEAAALYKKIQTEYPGTAAGDQASRMLLNPSK